VTTDQPTIDETAARLRAGEVTAVELATRSLEQIEREQETINAFITVTPEVARKQAQAAEARARRGERLGPLDGIPWAVILASSLVFGIWHGLSFSAGHFGFDIMSALFPFIGSIAGGWLRFRTGSLLVPVLGHGLANAAFHIAGGL